MPTEYQLIEALRRADAAGDTQAATRFAELIKQGRNQQSSLTPEESDIPVPGHNYITEPQPQPQQNQPFLNINPDLPRGDISAAIVEPALAIGSGIASMVPAGLAGMYSAATGGDVRKTVEDVQSKLTFEPKTQLGQGSLQLIGRGIEATTIPEAVSMAKEKYGELGYEKAGPVGGAIGQMIPDALMLVLGGKGATEVPTIARGGVETAKNVAAGVSDAVKTLAGKPEIRVYDDSGMFTPEVMSVLKKKESEGINVDQWISGHAAKAANIGPEEAAKMAENLNLFRKRGIEPTRANITQSTSDWKVQQDALKESGDLSALVSNQDAQLTRLAREGVEGIGAKYTDMPSSSNEMYNVTTNLRDAVDNSISQAYKEAEAAYPKKPIVSLSNFSEELKNLSPKDSRSNGLVGSIIKDMENRGILKPGMFEPAGKLNPGAVENIRKELNQMYRDYEKDFSAPAQVSKGIIHDLKEAIDSDSIRDVGGDTFRKARLNKMKLEKIFEREKGSKYDRNSGNIINQILYNQIPEADIIPRLIRTKRPEEFEQAYNFFNERSGVAGKAALTNMKASILDDAINKAISGGKSEGVQAFNARKFSSVFEELRSSKGQRGEGAKTKYEMLFTPQERSLIEDIEKIGKLRTPDMRVPLGSGPTGDAVLRSLASVQKRLLGRFGLGEKYNIANAMLQGRMQKQAMTLPDKEIQQVIQQRTQNVNR